MSRLHRFAAGPGIALYIALAALTCREVGLVGEVAIGWGSKHPPTVLTRFVSPEMCCWFDYDALGPLVAAQTRPVERLEIGDQFIPIAINAYTGGLSDLPARLVTWAFGWRVGAWTGFALGALLLALAARFLQIHAGDLAAGLVAVLLATDWSFVFYKRVLSGTEVLLQAGALLTVWAIWSRRWRGGVHGTLGIALGLAFGLQAKATFVATIAAILIAVVATRRDQPSLRPPTPLRWSVLLGLPLLGLLPIGIANLHAATVPVSDRVYSHDTLAMQFQRLGGTGMAREGSANLLAFFGDPNAFWSAALHADPVPWLSVGRAFGWMVLLFGAWIVWTDREGTPSPSDALLRFLSVLCPAQTALLFLANHDLHHLAQSSLFWCLALALAACRVAGLWGRPRSLRRVLLAGALLAPTLLSGALQLVETDGVMRTAPQSTFRESGQRALLEMLAAHDVKRLVTSDYEVYGMLDIRAPDIRITHTWAAFTRGERVDTWGLRIPAGRSGVEPWRVLKLAKGSHYLALRPTAPMVYNWSPKPSAVQAAAQTAGVTATEVGALDDAEGRWATLWRIE